MRRSQPYLASVALALVAGPAAAATIEIGPGDNLAAALAGLNPADELVLRGGTYEPTSRLGVTLIGNEAQPIVVRAKTGERPILPPIDLHPTVGSALVGAGAPAHAVVDDFDVRLRGGIADAGAYAYTFGGAPAWSTASTFKGDTPLPPLADGGGADGALGPDGGGSASRELFEG